MADVSFMHDSPVVDAIYRHWERTAASDHRDHLGASIIGGPCSRKIWFTWRWVSRKKIDGRLARLFAAGHAFEPRIVAELQAIGVEVHQYDDRGDQWRVSDHGGHFGGSMDGAAVGVPGAEKAWHVLEFKTHSEKSFSEVRAKGVQAAKPEHYSQMQTYMGLSGMDRALYVAENKNTSELYAERVHFDKDHFELMQRRARLIIEATEPPPRLSVDPSHWVCKMCDFHAHCHGSAVPEVNCRTCAHSTPVLEGEGGQWRCEHHKMALDGLQQREGCAGHRFIPILLERIATPTGYISEPDGNSGVLYRANESGKTFGNGGPPHFSSAEIRANPEMVTDDQVQQLKAEFETARLVA